MISALARGTDGQRRHCENHMFGLVIRREALEERFIRGTPVGCGMDPADRYSGQHPLAQASLLTGLPTPADKQEKCQFHLDLFVDDWVSKLKHRPDND
ncbi:unnamed protein product, partial [Timema podura]|nr:unnamed protein product [Timema podura]